MGSSIGGEPQRVASMIRRAREVARCAVRLGTAVALVSTMRAAAPARADIGPRKTSAPRQFAHRLP